tara:strand:+ start:826 stop:1626 length:801 start_codon:yes stop_codon:yes gene_type:complete
MLNILSLGAGVQSSTMALMAAKGDFEQTPDCAIFSDTGWEPVAIYEWLDWLEQQLPYPVYRVSAGSLVDDLIKDKKNYNPIPYYLKDDKGKKSIGRRQCTREYKITPIRNKIRSLLGLKKGQRAGKEVLARQWIGITTDEALRAKPNRDAFIENIYPLINKGMHRHDCIRWMEKNNFPKPSKSACIGCPFRTDAQWRDLKTKSPEEWDHAVKVDRLIRKPSKYGVGHNAQRYMHKQCVPLDQVDLRSAEDKGQYNFLNECEGMCGL